MNRVAALVDSALRNAWVFEELPWNLQVDPERARFPEESFFAAGLRPFRAMNTSQRRAFVFRETCFHLSNLLVGERSGEQLVAQVLVLTARDQPWHRDCPVCIDDHVTSLDLVRRSATNLRDPAFIHDGYAVT